VLVLSRHTSEKILCVTDDTVLEISVVEIKGDRVRLGIQAPEKVGVYREEVLDKIISSNGSIAMRYRTACRVCGFVSSTKSKSAS
jgi:carbon storage regulator